jgi:hypothetical protein
MELASGRTLERFFENWIFSDAIPTVEFSYKQSGDTVALRLEQRAAVMEFPVTVKLNYSSGESEELIVPIADRLTERTVPLRGQLRSIDVNDDYAALVRVER